MPAELFARKPYERIVADLIGEATGGAGGRTALTDASVGSVMRTLMETFARELAVAYEQLDLVCRSAYLDTADGAALDNVVALLGIERQRAGGLIGAVEFSRLLPAEADIAIPTGTLVTGRDAPLFETVREGVLGAGEKQIRIDVRSVEASPKADRVEPGAITLMPRPITGIERATNSTALLRRQMPETDAELRARARRAVRRSQAGTLAGLETAVRACGVARLTILEDPQGAPGEVTIVLGESDLPEAVIRQVHDVVAEMRPAGVRVSVNLALPVRLRIAAALELTRSVPPEEQEAIRRGARAALDGFFAQLQPGEPVRLAKLAAVLAGDDRVALAAPIEAGLALAEAREGAGPGGAPRTPAAGGLFAVSTAERLVLSTEEGWPRIEVRLPGLRLDVAIALHREGTDPASVDRAALLRAASEAIGRLLKDKAGEQERAGRQREAGESPAPVTLTQREVAAAVADRLAAIGLGAVIDPASLRAEAVHERDGRAVLLTAGGAPDELAPGEVPRLGAVVIV